MAPRLPAPDEWQASVVGSGTGGLDRLVGTQQPGTKSLADVVRELKRRKPVLVMVGGNGGGQLAIGTVNASGVAAGQEVKSLAAKYAPVGLAAGESHAACVTVSGAVMVWGDGAWGQLGVGPSLERSPRPYLLKRLRQLRAVSVACGERHTLVALDDSRVFAFGDGTRWGELGLPSPAQCWEPTEVPGLPAGLGPASVFCGRVTSGAVYGDGACFMWGCNAAGQCGQPIRPGSDPASLSQPTPARVVVDPSLALGSSRVLTAAAGDFFSLFVVGPERVLLVAGCPLVSRDAAADVMAGDREGVRREAGMAGDGGFALRQALESGLSGLKGPPPAPEEGDTSHGAAGPITAVLDVSAGHTHGAAVRANGSVFMVGRGHLGLPPDEAAVLRSAEMRHADADGRGDGEASSSYVATAHFVRLLSVGLEGCVAASCGAAHTVLGTRTGRLLSFGLADVAQTGTGGYGWTLVPKLCDALARPMQHVEAFVAGGDFTAAVTYPGARGGARERELATTYADLWLRRALGRGLGETILAAGEAEAEIDSLAADLARAAGLSGVVMQVTG